MFNAKKKIDAKIRFQNSYFKNRLRQARGYKRAVRKIPSGQKEIFLSKIGLGTLRARIISAVVLIAAIYLVFIPNLFFIKQIIITGVKTEDQAEAVTAVNFYLRRSRLWPQKNILTVSKTGLRNYLLANSQKILSVAKIEKKFPNTLAIDIQPRFNKLLLVLPAKKFVVSNDGMILRQIPAQELATSSELTNLISLNLTNDDSPGLGQKYLNADLINFMTEINRQLPSLIRAAPKNFEMRKTGDLDLKVQTTGGYALIFDVKSDLRQILGELSLLLSNLSAASLKQLSYIDLRFQGKGSAKK